MDGASPVACLVGMALMGATPVDLAMKAELLQLQQAVDDALESIKDVGGDVFRSVRPTAGS